MQTQQYLSMLNDSKVPIGYSGVCKMLNCKIILAKILPCITDHIAPYSPIFFSSKYQLFFYFHHTGSIGLYYREEEQVFQILERAKLRYVGSPPTGRSL
ncbi:hypothetical protein ABIB62_003317 [Mucilaginibacter sp. UYP25]